MGHDVVQGGAEPLEQQRVAVEVVAKQARAASALGEEQGGGLEAELAPSAGTPILRTAAVPSASDTSATNAACPPRSVTPTVSTQSRARDSTTDGSSSSQAAFPSTRTLLRTSSGTSSHTRLL
jgi:hypothetical protein